MAKERHAGGCGHGWHCGGREAAAGSEGMESGGKQTPRVEAEIWQQGEALFSRGGWFRLKGGDPQGGWLVANVSIFLRPLGVGLPCSTRNKAG